MKNICIILLFILISLIFSQTEKGISIKTTAGNEGKRWAICVGINNYDYSGILDLKKARNDAEFLGASLKDYGQFDYVFVMTDNDPRSVDYPSLGKFRSKLKYLEQFLEPEDLVVFSFSG
ncbi:MAG: caspase family protein, partial [Candidatus Delongbacteria bacterium]|nr:caspase family protein [Candidatus Delongbacteria bacterium]